MRYQKLMLWIRRCYGLRLGHLFLSVRDRDDAFFLDGLTAVTTVSMIPNLHSLIPSIKGSEDISKWTEAINSLRSSEENEITKPKQSAYNQGKDGPSSSQKTCLYCGEWDIW